MAQSILQYDLRSERAAGICDRQELLMRDDGSWQVRDTAGSGKWHIVLDGHCDCADYVYRRVTCKHIRATREEERSLAQFCESWDVRSEQARAAVELDDLPGDFLDTDFSAFDDDVLTATAPRCPDCGAPLDTRQYYAGGKGYTYVKVCTRDIAHRALPA